MSSSHKIRVILHWLYRPQFGRVKMELSVHLLRSPCLNWSIKILPEFCPACGISSAVLNCAFIFKMCFHFQDVLSFSKCVSNLRKPASSSSSWPKLIHQNSTWIFHTCEVSRCTLQTCFHFQNLLSILKCAFIFEMCFHFQNLRKPASSL